MAINYKDPRYQQAILSSMANPLGNKVAAQKKVTSDWASNQQAWNLGLAKMGLSADIHSSNMDLAYNRLDWQKSQFDRGLRTAKKASNYALYGGIGNALVAGWIGRQRREELGKQHAQQQRILDRLENKYG